MRFSQYPQGPVHLTLSCLEPHVSPMYIARIWQLYWTPSQINNSNWLITLQYVRYTAARTCTHELRVGDIFASAQGEATHVSEQPSHQPLEHAHLRAILRRTVELRQRLCERVVLETQRRLLR